MDILRSPPAHQPPCFIFFLTASSAQASLYFAAYMAYAILPPTIPMPPVVGAARYRCLVTSRGG